VFGPAGRIGGLFAYLATARRQEASDRATARQLAWSVNSPPGLELTWLGTAGFRMAYEGTVVPGRASRDLPIATLDRRADRIAGAAVAVPHGRAVMSHWV
jgi:hypothetical protein